MCLGRRFGFKVQKLDCCVLQWFWMQMQGGREKDKGAVGASNAWCQHKMHLNTTWKLMWLTYQAYETVGVEYKIMCCSFLISNESMHSSDLQMHSKTSSKGLPNHNSWTSTLQFVITVQMKQQSIQLAVAIFHKGYPKKTLLVCSLGSYVICLRTLLLHSM